MRSVGDGGATSAIRKKLALGAFLKLSVVAVAFHLLQPQVTQAVGKSVSDLAVCDSPSGVNVAGGKNRQMAVSAVVASVNHSFLGIFWNPEPSLFVIKKRPQMVFLVAQKPPFSFKIKAVVMLELLVALEQKLVIFFRRDSVRAVALRGTVVRESENIHVVLGADVNQLWDFGDIFDDTVDIITLCIPASFMSGIFESVVLKLPDFMNQSCVFSKPSSDI